MPAKSLENLSKVFQENRKITLLESEISSLLMKFAEAITIEREEEARQYDLAIERALHWMEAIRLLNYLADVYKKLRLTKQKPK